MKLCVYIPMHVPSAANLREHWATKHRRVSRQRLVVGAEVRNALHARHVLPPIEVSLCRVAPRPLDGDNLQSAFKSIRDGVTDGLGLRDDRERVGLSWSYSQRKGKPKEHAVEIRVEAA